MVGFAREAILDLTLLALVSHDRRPLIRIGALCAVVVFSAARAAIDATGDALAKAVEARLAVALETLVLIAPPQTVVIRGRLAQ